MNNLPVEQDAQFDVVVVGAGFAGIYLLYRLRQMGLRVRVYEAADDVGGTWYWNQYPGARCDAESLAYSFSFDETLEQEWQWSERYATAPEIMRYAQHVCQRFDLYRDMRFERRVVSAHFHDDLGRWLIRTDVGDSVSTPYLVMATGCLSVPMVPRIEGLDDFRGHRYQASTWPHEGVDFSGQRVGIIGTGSSAIQAIPVIAEQARHLTVFQRTPNFSVPARNGPLSADWVNGFKANYRGHRANHKMGVSSGFGDLEIEPRARGPVADSAVGLTDPELDGLLEERWRSGGAFFLGVVADAIVNPQTNTRIAAFVHRKILETVRDPATAEALCPTSHPIGTKRICVDTNYYETFNRDNVSLVNLRQDPIQRISAHGVQLQSGHVALDALVLATGFDAMTGALLKIDIRGSNGQRLSDKWAVGPRTYLGLMMAGFPNLFTVTGPGSPSVLSNMMVSIEQHVDFIVDCLAYATAQGADRIETSLDAEDAWVEHVNGVANATLFPKGGSWYLGANVPGKPRVFMPYAAGVGAYRELCDAVVADDYRGFVFNRTR